MTTLSLIPSFGACTKSCFVPRYRSVVWTDAWPRSNWICSRAFGRLRAEFHPPGWHAGQQLSQNVPLIRRIIM
jgi:hypothetical protein